MSIGYQRTQYFFYHMWNHLCYHVIIYVMMLLFITLFVTLHFIIHFSLYSSNSHLIIGHSCLLLVHSRPNLSILIRSHPLFVYFYPFSFSSYLFSSVVVQFLPILVTFSSNSRPVLVYPLSNSRPVLVYSRSIFHPDKTRYVHVI